MIGKPNVDVGQWISIGQRGKDAVVCKIRDDDFADLEIVYLDDRNKAIDEPVKWNGSYWEFIAKGPIGGYADNNPRLQHFVNTLRRGKLQY